MLADLILLVLRRTQLGHYFLGQVASEDLQLSDALQKLKLTGLRGLAKEEDRLQTLRAHGLFHTCSVGGSLRPNQLLGVAPLDKAEAEVVEVAM